MSEPNEPPAGYREPDARAQIDGLERDIARLDASIAELKRSLVAQRQRQKPRALFDRGRFLCGVLAGIGSFVGVLALLALVC